MAVTEAMFSVVVLLSCVLIAQAVLPKRKFEYKFSFKGPHLVQQDQSVPFWEHGGAALAGDEGIRLTPSLRSKKGYVWTKNPFEYENWEIEVAVRVSGRGRIGADGMAIWYTKNKGVEGDVFGSNDKWDGLGIFLDSFDNDGQQNNPYIMAVTNDGTLLFEHANDGQSQMLGGCLRDFRNKPFPVRLRVEYYNKAITVFVNNGLTQNANEFEMCMRVENINLPKNGYLGVSAATGGLADDHDCLSFLTHSLLPPAEEGAAGQVSEEERKKFEKEFEDYYNELEKAKQDFQKQHPDKARMDPYQVDEDKWFESQNEREMKQIFDGQSNIHLTLKDLNRKMDELLGRQELVLSKISMGTQTGGQVPQGQVPQTGQQQMGQINIDTIKRHEVDKVFNNQNDLINQIRDMRTVINDVQQKANIIQGSGGQQQGGGGGGVVQLTLHELKDNLNNARNDIAMLLTRPQAAAAAANCPTQSGCLTPLVFFIALAAQVILMIGYMVYKQNKEAQAKKFY
ncbi:protein ERGIC-53-like [Haliotis rufescens]|uniref:protein ERGIC-53-like n=1 Tax=Haliotis rufescens TaxID=6454 RepID=UPI00201EED65|nr:protein ERGIC-53-like [Haliotis rufescens]